LDVSGKRLLAKHQLVDGLIPEKSKFFDFKARRGDGRPYRSKKRKLQKIPAFRDTVFA
jgi:hypothetical protein